MKFAIMTGVAAIAMAWTMNAAFAQMGPHISDGSSPGYSATQHALTTEPGYSVGTGSSPKADVHYDQGTSQSMSDQVKKPDSSQK